MHRRQTLDTWQCMYVTLSGKMCTNKCNFAFQAELLNPWMQRPQTPFQGSGARLGMVDWHWTKEMWVDHSWPWQWPLCDDHGGVGGYARQCMGDFWCHVGCRYIYFVEESGFVCCVMSALLDHDVIAWKHFLLLGLFMKRIPQPQKTDFSILTF